MLPLPFISRPHPQPRRLLRLCLAGLGLILSAGCFSLPKPDYFKVDRNTPEFKQAVASEAERQRERGVSAAKAEKKAEVVVSRQIVQSEMDRRREQVAPLVQALAAFDRPLGCWAYTVTTTSRNSGVTTVLVETFDASQPEERVWTLLCRDGQPPDEKAQADYRAEKLRVWRKQLGRTPPIDLSEKVKSNAVWREMEITPPAPDGQTTFSFTFTADTGESGVEVPHSRDTYTIDTTTGVVVGKTHTLLSPFSWLGIKMEEFATTGEYTLIDPAAPPLPARMTFHGRGSFLGNAMDLEEEESVYTNYRRVKCYDARFSVQIGEMRVIDSMSGKK